MFLATGHFEIACSYGSFDTGLSFRSTPRLSFHGKTDEELQRLPSRGVGVEVHPQQLQSVRQVVQGQRRAGQGGREQVRPGQGHHGQLHPQDLGRQQRGLWEVHL